MPDFLYQGAAHGEVAKRLMQFGGDPGALRPFIGEDGRSYITVNGGTTTYVINSPATLRKDEWILLDETVIRVAKQRLRAWADLEGRAGLRYSIPNGMAKTVLQYQDVSDISPATISMDGLRQSDRDRPVFDIVNLPLPIIHKDFSFSAREIMVSRTGANTMQGGAGAAALDTTTAELAARRCAEEVEKLLLGVSASYSFGGGTIYGYTNFPQRATKVMTAPTGANAPTTLAEVLDMKALSQALNHYGPWMVYNSLSWDKWLDNDYILTGGTSTYQTLRDRIEAIDGILGIQTLDYLPAKTMLLVEMNPEVVRAVVGMDFTTLEWETHGGMQLNYKIMTIRVPQLRKDQLAQTGIVHGTHP